MVLHRALGQGESLPDRGVAEPVGDQGGDLELAAGESGLGPAGRGQLGRKLGSERVHAEPSGESGRGFGVLLAHARAEAVRGRELGVSQCEVGQGALVLAATQRRVQVAPTLLFPAEQHGKPPQRQRDRALVRSVRDANSLQPGVRE